MTVDHKNLNAAILKAQRAAKAIAKGSTNEYAKYDYASADSIVEECRGPLAEAGLTVYRAAWEMNRKDDQWFVVSYFIVSHAESGESTERAIHLPVVSGKTPIDKAALGVLTTSLGYFLRDLLLLPRADENEIDRRNDKDTERPLDNPPKTGDKIRQKFGKSPAAVLDRGMKNAAEEQDFEALCKEAGITVDAIRAKAKSFTKEELGNFSAWPEQVKKRAREYVEKLMDKPIL